MTELLKRVLHHLEGEEVTQHEAWFSGDDKPRTVTVRTCGTERWIRRVHERQVLTAFDAIALIHLAVVDYFDFPTEEQEKAVVEGWALELIKSAHAKEVIARDPFTFLPFEGDLESLKWGLSMSDADSFITARGMKWTFSELAQRVYNQDIGTPANQLNVGDGGNGDYKKVSEKQSSTTKHTSNGSPHRDTDLTTEILKAISKADDPNSDNSVWTALRAMALNGEGLFTGLVDGEGLHYEKSSDNDKATFNKAALSKRLTRIKAKSATKSR